MIMKTEHMKTCEMQLRQCSEGKEGSWIRTSINLNTWERRKGRNQSSKYLSQELTKKRAGGGDKPKKVKGKNQ